MMFWLPRKNIYTRGPKWQRGSFSMFPAGTTSITAGGDTVDIQPMSANEDSTGSASALCLLYGDGAVSSRDGQAWADENGVRTFNHQVISPGESTAEYQVKWDDPTTGTTPTATSSKGVWYALSAGDWSLLWDVGVGPGDDVGSVTVSIRKGTGPVIDSAIWDGEAIASGKGK